MGCSGFNPAAIKSALMKFGQLDSFGRNSKAKVVFPAPFGPAMIKMRLVKTTAQLQKRVDSPMKEFVNW